MKSAKKSFVQLMLVAITVASGGTLSLAQTAGNGQSRSAVAPSKQQPGETAPNEPQTQKLTPFTSATLAPSVEAAAPDKIAIHAGMEALPIYVVAVEGSVGYRKVGEKKYTPLKGGEWLPDGIELAVGLKRNSAVRIQIGEHQIFTFDQQGTTELSVALLDKNTQTSVTRMNVKQGRVSFDVDSAKSKNDVKIQTPDMVLAVKGTKGAVQVAQGFDTVAFGDVDNTGHIQVDWYSGVRVDMRRNEQTDAATQDPARNADALASVDTPRTDSRDKDEKRLLKRATSAKQDIELNVGNTKGVTPVIDLLPGIGNPTPPPPVVAPGPTNVQHLDATRGTLFQTTPGLSSTLLRSGLQIDPGATMGGSAIVHDGSNGAGRLVYLETSSPSAGTVLNRFSEIPYNTGETSPRLLAGLSGDASQTPTLSGLGAIGSSLYASGSFQGRDGIYRVDLERGELTQAMDVGAALEGGLGGSTANGTLFAIARDPGAAPGASLLDRSVVLEVDPRTNYLANVYTGLGGSSGSSSVNTSGVDLNTLQSFTGVAAINGGVMISAVSDANGGRMVLMRYETGSETSSPQLASVRRAPETITHGLASEAAGAVRASVPLSNPVGQIDRVSISATFADMGYSRQALDTGFVERTVQREILATSANPAACATSGALGSVREILQSHVGERAGIGRSVTEFRAMLPLGHPCKCPSGRR